MQRLPVLSLLCGFTIGAIGRPSLAAPLPAQVDPTKVRIYYDGAMVPHIFGPDDRAALYGLGYHHMRDFPVATLNLLWEHSANFAKLVGESGIDEDQLMLLWEVPAIAERHRAELEAQGLLPLIDAYVQGLEDGRAWWRENGDPAASSRLAALLGPNLEARFDPVPYFLNPVFSPYGQFGDPEVATSIRRVFQRMFDASMPVTREHVLRLGVAVNSQFLYLSDLTERDVLPGASHLTVQPPELELFDPSVPGEDTVEWFETPEIPIPVPSGGSNSWLVAGHHVQGGSVATLSDIHVSFNTTNIRPYLGHVSGGLYQLAGLMLPGHPVVIEGFNDHISLAVTAFPFVTGSRWPVSTDTWKATLEPSPDLQDPRPGFRFHFPGEPPGGDFVHLVSVTEDIPYFDPATGNVPLHAYERFYVPVHPAEIPSPPPQHPILFTRYPVLPEGMSPPEPGDEIFFTQASFTCERSPWEFGLRVGRARNATSDLDAVLADVLLLNGSGRNLLVADREQNFRYLYMTRCPIQGPDAKPPYDHALDGTQLGARWLGLHDVDELPSIGPVSVAGTDEVFDQCNVTPDLVDPGHPPSNYPPPRYMGPNVALSSFRQLRADELLRGQEAPLSAGQLEDFAADQTDNWSRKMWPIFVQVRNLIPPRLSNEASRLIDWIDEYRHDDENDLSDPSIDFVAHVYSQVTVYTTLLRSHYQDKLAALREAMGLTRKQLLLGLNPLHPLFSNPSELGAGEYEPNILALVHALETVAALWKRGSGVLGLQNQGLIAYLNHREGLGRWSDPRYSTPIEPQWENEIAGKKVTRWGQVQVLCATPHYLVDPRRELIEGFAGQGEDPLMIERGYLYSGLYPHLLWPAGKPFQFPGNLTQSSPGAYPGLVKWLPFSMLKVPFYDQEVEVWPIGGTDESLWKNKNVLIFPASRPRGYQEGVYRWNRGNVLYFSPKSSGSVVTFAASLPPESANLRATGRFLLSLGGTEITKSDLLGGLGDHTLAYQERFAPCGDFASRNWRTLFLDESLLGNPQYVLTPP